MIAPKSMHCHRCVSITVKNHDCELQRRTGTITGGKPSAEERQTRLRTRHITAAIVVMPEGVSKEMSVYFTIRERMFEWGVRHLFFENAEYTYEFVCINSAHLYIKIFCCCIEAVRIFYVTDSISRIFHHHSQSDCPSYGAILS